MSPIGYIAAGLGALLALLAGAFLLLTEPGEPPRQCRTETHGLLRVADCGLTRHAMPLRVYSRWPERHLGDCEYWAHPDGALCGLVFWLRNT
jgi:hypothetical protein